MDYGALISQYGYLLIIVGVFIEGEAVVITAGLLASRGLLPFEGVVAAAFAGSLVTYQSFFLLGRLRGRRFLRDHPRWGPRVARVRGLLERHHLWVILAYRFFYGLRSITPFALGMTDLRPLRFLLLDMGPALAWAVLFTWVGYAFGNALERFVVDFERYEPWVVLGLLLAGLLVLACWVVLSRRSGR